MHCDEIGINIHDSVFKSVNDSIDVMLKAKLLIEVT